ncbi:hypothetical protein Q7P35_006367 [Cladosporium inversicolor]
MADTATTTSSDAPENETPNQRTARLRREKRNAKMAATGEDRLARIKGLNGGIAPPDEALGGPVVAPSASAPKAATVDDDPEEVDISDHPYTSKNVSQTGTPRGGGAAQDNPLQQAMMQMQAQQAQQAQGGGEEDPMAKMMQQLMGMQGGQDPNDPNAMGQDLPQMAQMLSTMMGGGGLGGAGQQQPSTGSAYLWRIVHAISALIIAVYIALTTTFSGSKLARTENAFIQDVNYGLGAKPFYIFATAELVLQSSRYFVEKGQLQGGGILATIANSGFVPEPYAQLIRTVGRYSTIYTTIVSDAIVVVFVLGAIAWWKGLAAS